MKRNELVDMLMADFSTYRQKGQAAYDSRIGQLGTAPVSGTSGMSESQLYAAGYNAMTQWYMNNKQVWNPAMIRGVGQVELFNNGWETWIDRSVYKDITGKHMAQAAARPIATPQAANNTPPAAPRFEPVPQRQTSPAIAQGARPAVTQQPVASASGTGRVTVRLDELALVGTLIRDAMEGWSIICDRLSTQDQVTVGYRSAGPVATRPVVSDGVPFTQGLVPTPLVPGPTAAAAANKVLYTNKDGTQSWLTPAQIASRSPEAMARARAAKSNPGANGHTAHQIVDTGGATAQTPSDADLFQEFLAFRAQAQRATA